MSTNYQTENGNQLLEAFASGHGGSASLLARRGALR